MKILIFIITIVAFIACSQNKKTKEHGLPERIQYVSNPRSSDTLCISEIERAKKDIANGKIVFTQKFGFGSQDFRYEKQLKELCKKHGLGFGIDLISCVSIEGETQGCYSDYMDKIIIEKFGIGFKEKMHKEADSIFLEEAKSNNIIVQASDCDERPRLPSETKRTDDYLASIKITNLNIKKKQGQYGGWPFFDLGFIVEKDSTINGFYINNFVANHKDNNMFKSKLFGIAVDSLKKNYSLWVPGKIKGTPVRTDNNVRIFLVKE